MNKREIFSKKIRVKTPPPLLVLAIHQTFIQYILVPSTWS